MVSPSATTKPQTLAQAGNGAIIQGRPEDVGVVQVGKTADFQTASQLMMGLEKRISEGFLILNVRDSERTTAEEVRMTQLELEQSLGGLFSLLTVEFLIPYLNRTLLVLQRSNQIPKLPKDVVRPRIVAGVNQLGRGIDVLNLVKTEQQLQQDMQQAQQQQAQQELMKQAGQFANTPMMDSSKDPKAEERIDAISQAINPTQE